MQTVFVDFQVTVVAVACCNVCPDWRCGLCHPAPGWPQVLNVAFTTLRLCPPCHAADAHASPVHAWNHDWCHPVLSQHAAVAQALGRLVEVRGCSCDQVLHSGTAAALRRSWTDTVTTACDCAAVDCLEHAYADDSSSASLAGSDVGQSCVLRAQLMLRITM